MNDHTTSVNQADLFAKSVDDVRPGQSSQNGNGQPSSKWQRVPSDEALVSDDIIVNKWAKPDLNEACAKAYKNYRNTAVCLAR